MTNTVTPRATRLRRVFALLPVLGLALAVSGCETLDKMNPFTEKEKALPGARTPVFPEGVPGVDYNAPPPQPANSAKYDMPAQTPAAAAPAQ